MSKHKDKHDKPYGVYIVKGSVTDFRDPKHIFFQSNGCGCTHRYVRGKLHRLLSYEEAQHFLIFNIEFWYTMNWFDDNTALTMPLDVIRTIKDESASFHYMYKWYKKKYGLEYNMSDSNGFEGRNAFYRKLELLSRKDRITHQDLKDMVVQAVTPLLMGDVKHSGPVLEVVDEVVNEAFVNINILQGGLVGPAILIWDNCD